MGNKGGPMSEFDQKDQWQPLGTEFGAQILRNTETKQEVQKYRVDAVDIQKLQIELMLYNLRMHQFPNCIQILYYSFEKSESICGKGDCFIVVTERTERFIQMGQLTLLEARYMLKECLVGFNSLFEVFGLFDIEPPFIAINDQGKVKVWLNDIYGLNTIDEEPCASHTQSRQIRRLISIIERKIMPEQLPVDFGNEIIRAETLKEAIDILQTAKQEVSQSRFGKPIPNPGNSADTTTFTAQNLRPESVQQEKRTLQQYYKILRKPPPQVQVVYQSPPLQFQPAQQSASPIKASQAVLPKPIQPPPQPVQVVWNSSALALTLDPHDSLRRASNHSISNKLIHVQANPSPYIQQKRYSNGQDQQSQTSRLSSQSSQFLIHPHIPPHLREIPVVDSMIVIQKGTDSRVDWARTSIEESRVVSHM